MLRRTTRLFATLAIVLGAVTAAARAGTPPSYPLMCRGGGDMWLAISDNRVHIEFRGARRGANVAPPGPGECAWLDRGFRPGEANYGGLSPGRSILVLRDYGLRDLLSVRIRRGRVEVQAPPGSPLGRLIEAVRAGRVFNLHAYRHERSGAFIVTRLGP